jgi:hypothetical protein
MGSAGRGFPPRTAALVCAPATEAVPRLVTAGIARQLRLEMPPPRQIEFRFDRIPRDLRAIPQWAAWRYAARRRPPPAAAGWSKMPIDPASGRAAKSNDRSTWGTFDAALAYYRMHRDDADPFTVAHGLGLMLSSDLGLIGGDIDHCIDAGGVLSPFAQHILLMLGSSYVEVSPSGSGIRFFVYGRRPGGSRDRNDDLGLEVYDGLRFLTITGSVLPGFETLAERQPAVIAICQAFLAEAPDSDPGSAGELARPVAAGEGGTQPPHLHGVRGVRHREAAPVVLSGQRADADRLGLVVGAEAGEELDVFPGPNEGRWILSDLRIEQVLLANPKSARLWAGDWHGYPSQSNADAALVTRLGVLTGMDAERTYRLFTASGLYREKWYSPRPGGSYADYGEYTIEQVFNWMRSRQFSREAVHCPG